MIIGIIGAMDSEMASLIEGLENKNTKTLFIIVIIILALEMLSGVMKAIKNKELNSTKFREGLLSKSGYFVQIGLVLLVSMMINMPYLMCADLIWIACSEGVSVLENLEGMGVPFPEFLKSILEKTKIDAEKEVEK